MTEMTKELVIFDHDGVLVDSEIIAMELLAELASNHGKPTTIDVAFQTYLGTSLDYVIDDLRAHGAVLDEQRIHREFHTALYDRFRTSLQPIPGMHDLLTSLRSADTAIAIASSGERDRVELGTTTTGLRHFFDSSAITTREDASRGKPHPDLFLVAAERGGVDPTACIVIEDSAHGVEAAKRAGMAVIGLAYRTPASALADADWVVRDVYEMHALLMPSGV
jgi:HAD superfamily hydrolase (TIGR01509 family)